LIIHILEQIGSLLARIKIQTKNGWLLVASRIINPVNTTLKFIEDDNFDFMKIAKVVSTFELYHRFIFCPNLLLLLLF